MCKSSKQFNPTAESAVSSGLCGGSRATGSHRGEVEQDTSPSNTVSDKYNEGFFRAFRWGVDSLYLSFPGELHFQSEIDLKKLKLLAQSQLTEDQSLAQMSLGGHLFEVKDKGAGLFPYVLEDNAFRIQLSRATAKSMPMAYVKISSEYLTHKKVEEIVHELRKVLNELGNIDYMPKVSRIDLFVDFVASIDMESWDRHAWVTRAASINQYSVDNEFSGWTVGIGSVMAARLYNKCLELAKSQKYYLMPLWNDAGWKEDEDGDVWRLEFQFKRDILSQFDVQSLSATLDNLNGLWSYATTEWLKLTIPSADDTNRSRWPVHPLWACLSSIDFDADGGALSRTFSPRRVPSDRYLSNHGFSVLSSFMAREGITDFGKGIEAFRAWLSNDLNNRSMNNGEYFDSFVEKRVAAKARNFNSIQNKPADDGSNSAEEYRKQSDGE